MLDIKKYFLYQKTYLVRVHITRWKSYCDFQTSATRSWQIWSCSTPPTITDRTRLVPWIGSHLDLTSCHRACKRPIFSAGFRHKTSARSSTSGSIHFCHNSRMKNLFFSQVRFVPTSVTRWQDCVFNIWPFTAMNICPKAYKLCQSELKLGPKPNKP